MRAACRRRHSARITLLSVALPILSTPAAGVRRLQRSGPASGPARARAACNYTYTLHLRRGARHPEHDVFVDVVVPALPPAPAPAPPPRTQHGTRFASLAPWCA